MSNHDLRDKHPDQRSDDEADAALAAFGLVRTRSFVNDAVVFIWPECVLAWRLWLRLQTQWQTAGMDATPTGLRYEGVSAAFDLLGITDERAELFSLIQHMESATLDEQHNKVTGSVRA